MVKTLLLYEKEIELQIIQRKVISYYVSQYKPNLLLFFLTLYNKEFIDSISTLFSDLDIDMSTTVSEIKEVEVEVNKDTNRMLITKVLDDFIAKNSNETINLVIKTSLLSFNPNVDLDTKVAYMNLLKKSIIILKQMYGIDNVILDYFTTYRDNNISISYLKETIEDEGIAVLNFRIYEKISTSFIE